MASHPKASPGPEFEERLAREAAKAALLDREERLAREDARAAESGLRGADHLAARAVKRYCGAEAAGDPLGVAENGARFMVALAQRQAAEAEKRASGEQLAKIEQRRQAARERERRALAERSAQEEQQRAELERERREATEKKLGRPPSRNSEAARDAYRKARAEGASVEAAVFEAKAAGGFRSVSRVYELKKEQHW